MTPADRYRAALDALGWSQRSLAPLLGCSDRLTRYWGVHGAPPEVQAWLEAVVKHRQRHPDPEPPTDWRQRLPAV